MQFARCPNCGICTHVIAADEIPGFHERWPGLAPEGLELCVDCWRTQVDHRQAERGEDVLSEGSAHEEESPGNSTRRPPREARVCPRCGRPLRTLEARQCLECGGESR